MIWKIAPLLLGALAAYLWRTRAIHEALSRRRPIRAALTWLGGCALTIPVLYAIFMIGLLVRELS